MKPNLVKIDSRVPIPIPKRGRPKGSSKYGPIFSRMKSGDSFVVPTESRRTSVSLFCMREGIKIITRRDEKTGGFRIWKS